MWQAVMAPARQGKCVMCVMRHASWRRGRTGVLIARSSEVITNGFWGGRQAIGVVAGSGVRVPAAAGQAREGAPAGAQPAPAVRRRCAAGDAPAIVGP